MLAAGGAPVAVEDDTEQLAGGCNADALLVAQLMQPALHAENALPILAISGASCHCSQQVSGHMNVTRGQRERSLLKVGGKRCDREALLHRLRRYVAAHTCSAVDCDDDAALEHETKRCCSVQKLDVGLAFAVLECSGKQSETNVTASNYRKQKEIMRT